MSIDARFVGLYGSVMTCPCISGHESSVGGDADVLEESIGDGTGCGEGVLRVRQRPKRFHIALRGAVVATGGLAFAGAVVVVVIGVVLVVVSVAADAVELLMAFNGGGVWAGGVQAGVCRWWRWTGVGVMEVGEDRGVVGVGVVGGGAVVAAVVVVVVVSRSSLSLAAQYALFSLLVKYLGRIRPRRARLLRLFVRFRL